METDLSADNERAEWDEAWRNRPLRRLVSPLQIDVALIPNHTFGNVTHVDIAADNYGTNRFMRYIGLVLLLLFASTLSACSFGTAFVVVNASGYPIEIVYRIGATGIDPLKATGEPATVETSQLSSREWTELSSTQYVFDQEKRTVTVSLMPGLALRINQGGEWRACETGTNFIIKEVDITGVNGEITLKGDQVYKSFVPEAKPFFGPPTLLTMTYK